MRAHRAALLRAWLLCAVGVQCLGSGSGDGGTVSAQQSGLEAEPWDVARSALTWVLDARPQASPAAQHAMAAQAVPRRLLQPGQGSAAAGGGPWPTGLLDRQATTRRERSAAGARRLMQGTPAAAPGLNATSPAYLLVVMEVRLLICLLCQPLVDEHAGADMPDGARLHACPWLVCVATLCLRHSCLCSTGSMYDRLPARGYNATCTHAQLHGGDIQPFNYEDRAALLHGMDDAIAAIRLENIELLAVEEILPASGPSSESLTSLLNDGSGGGPSSKGVPAAPPPAPPPASIRALAPASSARFCMSSRYLTVVSAHDVGACLHACCGARR